MTGVAPAGPLHGCRAALARGAVLGVALAATSAPWIEPAQAEATGARLACVAVDHPFQPSTLTIDGVLAPTAVIGRGQDRHGVPKPPPLTERGEWQLAWDKASGVRPGGTGGVVRLTAHTYPLDHPDDRPRRRPGEGGRAPALGNLLLARLTPAPGSHVTGAGGEQACYRVTRRQQVRATASLSGYYDTTGAPRLAILVCSGTRRGPGDWTHRTIWWAQPVATRDGAARAF